MILDGAGSALDSGVFLERINMDSYSNIDFTWSNRVYNEAGLAEVFFNSMSVVDTNDTYFWDFNNDGNIDCWNFAVGTYVPGGTPWPSGVTYYDENDNILTEDDIQDNIQLNMYYWAGKQFNIKPDYVGLYFYDRWSN